MNIVLIVFLAILITYITVIIIYRVKNPSYFMPEKTKQSLYEGMENVHNTLEKNNISYFIIAGTLLGAVRHGEFIPWDDDIDIGILEKDLDKFNSIKFEYNSTPATQTNCGKIFTENDGYIDIFVFREKDGKYEYIEENARKLWPNEFFLKEELFPVKKYNFGKLQLNGPQKFTPYCERSWGKTWKTPSLKLKKKLLYPIETIKMSFKKYEIPHE